jgi:hypothetical protein
MVYKQCSVEFAPPGFTKVIIKYLNEFNGASNFIYFYSGQIFFNGSPHLKDITNIQLSVPEQKPMNNTLDTNTPHSIAAALKPGAIKFIESHEKYAEVMTQLITEYVENNLGDANGELPFMIFYNIKII